MLRLHKGCSLFLLFFNQHEMHNVIRYLWTEKGKEKDDAKPLKTRSIYSARVVLATQGIHRSGLMIMMMMHTAHKASQVITSEGDNQTFVNAPPAMRTTTTTRANQRSTKSFHFHLCFWLVHIIRLNKQPEDLMVAVSFVITLAAACGSWRRRYLHEMKTAPKKKETSATRAARRS